MSCPRLSDVREYWESNPGTFLDTYIVSTTADDWQRVLETLHALAWPSSYYEDSEPASMPSDVREIFAHRELAACLWQIRPLDEVRINCNFFDEDEIEFSVDTREIVAQRQLEVMCEFISAIGRALDKQVLVGIEGGEPRPPAMMRYEPTVDDVVASRPPWW